MQTLNRLAYLATRKTYAQTWHIGNYSAYIASESQAGMTVDIYHKAQRIATWRWDALRNTSTLTVVKRRRPFQKTQDLAQQIKDAIENAGYWTPHSTLTIA